MTEEGVKAYLLLKRIRYLKNVGHQRGVGYKDILKMNVEGNRNVLYEKHRTCCRLGLLYLLNKDLEQAEAYLISNDSDEFKENNNLFDSAAQSLSYITKEHYTAKGLRLICRDYVIELDKKPRTESWIYQRFLADATQLNQNANKAKKTADRGYQQQMANIDRLYPAREHV